MGKTAPDWGRREILARGPVVFGEEEGDNSRYGPQSLAQLPSKIGAGVEYEHICQHLDHRTIYIGADQQELRSEALARASNGAEGRATEGAPRQGVCRPEICFKYLKLVELCTIVRDLASVCRCRNGGKSLWRGLVQALTMFVSKF